MTKTKNTPSLKQLLNEALRTATLLLPILLTAVHWVVNWTVFETSGEFHQLYITLFSREAYHASMIVISIVVIVSYVSLLP